jgi:hypothetical protein
MKILIAFGLAASAALAGADASAPTTVPATGRVVFTGPLPVAATGTVKYEGEKPEKKPLVIEAAKSEGCVHDGSVDTTDRSLIIGDNGGIANVVVMVEVKGAEAEVPEKPVHLDQKSCRFEPHVTVVPEGAPSSS